MRFSADMGADVLESWVRERFFCNFKKTGTDSEKISPPIVGLRVVGIQPDRPRCGPGVRVHRTKAMLPVKCSMDEEPADLP